MEMWTFKFSLKGVEVLYLSWDLKFIDLVLCEIASTFELKWNIFKAELDYG